MAHGFDNRIVLYEEIHNIRPEDERALLRAIDPQPGQRILDAMCGYGAVTKLVTSSRVPVEIFLVEESEVQIARARKENPGIAVSNFFLRSLPDFDLFSPGSFDTVVIKMGLHEVPKYVQPLVLANIARILKPAGRLVIWDIFLGVANQGLFQKVIRKKDTLAGFCSLAQNRYFFNDEEFADMVQAVGFHNMRNAHKIMYRFSSEARLNAELNGDPKKLEELNSYIRKVFPEELKKKLEYEDLGEDIRFLVSKAIKVVSK